MFTVINVLRPQEFSFSWLWELNLRQGMSIQCKRESDSHGLSDVKKSGRAQQCLWESWAKGSKSLASQTSSLPSSCSVLGMCVCVCVCVCSTKIHTEL